MFNGHLQIKTFKTNNLLGLGLNLRLNYIENEIPDIAKPLLLTEANLDETQKVDQQFLAANSTQKAVLEMNSKDRKCLK